MKGLVLFAIRLYQRTISRVVPPSCRFVPSCSEYGYESIVRYGIVRGGAMAIWRILRCNPWGGHGYDPVPGVAERAASSGQQAATRSQQPDPRNLRLRPVDESHGASPQSSVLMPPKGHPQSYDIARTPHAPGHSLTEGLL